MNNKPPPSSSLFSSQITQGIRRINTVNTRKLPKSRADRENAPGKKRRTSVPA